MHGFANPARFLRIARWLTPALLLSGLALAGAALAWGLTGLPAERLQGETVRIVLVHVPTAWLGMGGWTAIAVASLVELVWRRAGRDARTALHAWPLLAALAAAAAATGGSAHLPGWRSRSARSPTGAGS